MNYILTNDVITATLTDKGAELISLKFAEDKTEYLWTGDKAYWPRHAPQLFPIVGKLKDDKYLYKGNWYHMSQHGFARDECFEAMDISDKSMTFLLKRSEHTKKVYPFDFMFYVNYQLLDHKIMITYKVVNASNDKLFFSVGAHPGFNCPLSNTEKLEDYYLEFNETEDNASYRLTESNLIAKMSSSLPMENEKIMPITSHLFKDGVYVIKSPHSNKISLKSKASTRQVSVEFKNFPYLGIWAMEAAPFVCIEPWFGLADIEDSNYDLAQKEGIQTLEADKTFSCSYSIEIFE